MIILGPVAVAENGVIGKNNDLPWHLPEDLKHFKEVTLGKTVVMGRKTFDSIFARLQKPLPGRKNVIISRQKGLPVPAGVLVFNSLNGATTGLPAEDLYIIGGAEIFKLALPMAQLMHMTHVFGSYDGDAYFPQVDWNEWKKIESHKHPKFEFATYKRV